MRPEISTEGALTLQRSRVADYIVLTKPELTLLSVLTAMAGYYLGADGNITVMVMLHTLLGTALVGGGAGALNQYIEREYDALMKRTESRPLPSGRLSPREVLLFGLLLSAVGVIELTLFTNVLTGFLALTTLTTYLFLYTPLKRITPSSTIIGAVPGALPPVMGWTAATSEISLWAVLLFALLFFWQIPHFLSLAWMYRKDYARAGYRMLTVVDGNGSRTSANIVVFTIGLFITSVLPVLVGSFSLTYLLIALALGAAFLVFSLRLFFDRSNTAARHVFIGSLVYLPVLLVVMVMEKL